MILTSIMTWAVVTLSSAFMRQSPDYEAPLENQMLMGALVQTTGETNRYWVEVTAEDYTGWVTEMSLQTLSDAEKDAYLEAAKSSAPPFRGRRKLRLCGFRHAPADYRAAFISPTAVRAGCFRIR